MGSASLSYQVSTLPCALVILAEIDVNLSILDHSNIHHCWQAECQNFGIQPAKDLKHGATQDCTYLNLGGGMRLLNNSKDIFRKNFENGTA